MQRIMLGLLLLFSVNLIAQRPPETEDEFDANYNRRIQMEQINGVYIPADVGDAFAQLHQLIDKEAKQRFKKAGEDLAVRNLHFSLGRWIILNWGFYEGSRLSHSLRKMGLHHPDDMAKFIIRSFHRSLNSVPIEAKAQIDILNQARLEERQKRMKVLEEWRKPAQDSLQRNR